MQSKQFRVLFPVIFQLASLALLLWFLWVTLRIAQVRYFDADEFAYLHWAHNAFSGKVPYRDFLAYVPPVFYYVVSLLFFVTDTVDILMIGRLFSFGVFAGIILALMYLFWQMRRNVAAALFAGVLLVFIPIPADKFIEIRPDNLAMLSVIMAVILHVIALTGKGTTWTWTAAGVFYGLSLLILPKTLPQVAVAGIVTLLWSRWGGGQQQARVLGIRRIALGVAIPAGLFVVWLLVAMRSTEALMLAWYSLTRLPFEAQRISALFSLQPDLFFYPNDLLYGAPGWNRVLIVNHVIWGIGLIMGSFRLVTPFIPGRRNGVWAEVLVSGAFFGYIVSFMYGYPMRHEQYLIPVAIFVVFYAADAFGVLWERFSRHPEGLPLGPLVSIALLMGIFWMSWELHIPKRAHTNRNDYALLRFVLHEIPRGAYVFDLVGATIYFADPYYVSAVPFGQWEPYLTRPLPPVVAALKKTGAAYVYEGGLGRVDMLSPEARDYIRREFRPVHGVTGLYSRYIPAP